MATKSGSGRAGRRPEKATSAKAAPTAKSVRARPTAKPSTRATVAVLDDDTDTAKDAVAAGREVGATDAATSAPDSAGSGPGSGKPWPVRLYLGEIGIDFIGKRRLWYIISTVLVLICLASMIFRGFNLGVEFAGGERFRTVGTVEQLDEVTRAVEDTGAAVTSAQAVGDNQLVVITGDLGEAQGRDVSAAIADAVGVDATEVANSTTSASWGRDVTSKALQGLLVFLVLVLIFLAVRFQWKMAIGAMVALFHDLILTAGVYSIVGFEVTPASVIGLLTILGFSLYDTVVVFDKVDENTKGLLASQRRTYSQAANLAINQVLMRSINTSIFALLPVLGLLYAGVFLIGEGTLQDLALVLFVGLMAGVYSSIFLAAPVLCDLKEREPEYRRLAKRVNSRAAGSRTDRRIRSIPVRSQSLAAGAANPGISPNHADGADSPRGRRGKAATTGSGTAVPEPEVQVDPGTAEGSKDAQDAGALVASARRSRPRASSAPSGAGKVLTSSLGSRQVQSPGVKSAGVARKRGGSGKRNV